MHEADHVTRTGGDEPWWARLGRAAGLDRIGVCSVEDFEGVRASLEDRVATGLSGGLGFTFANPGRATSLRESFPWAQRLVVGAKAYLPQAGRPESADRRARVARFAVDDGYVPLRAGLEEVARSLVSIGHRCEILIDDARLVDRAAAVRAGIGWWGKNTMVLAPGLGPWMLLGSIVTDAELAVTTPMSRDCGSCEACLPACPTGALVAPGILDARRCLAAILQQPGVIPRWARGVIGDRLYGCDDCLEACPPGVRLWDASPSRSSHDVSWVLGATDDELEEAFGHFYLARGSVAMLRRNALVAAGNSRSSTLTNVVAGYTAHPDPVLRVHAAWAIRQIDPSWIGKLLAQLAEVETDPRVLEELQPDPSGK